MLGNESNKESIWSKMGELAKPIAKGVGRAAKVGAKATIYPARPTNWRKPWSHLWHDMKNAGLYIIRKPPLEEFKPSASLLQAESTTQDSKDLDVQIESVDYKDGRMIFEAARVSLGDIFHLTNEQLNQIKQLNGISKYSNVNINRAGGKIMIGVDVKEIIDAIKNDPDHKGKSEEEIRGLAIARIEQEVDSCLKKVGGITGGLFERNTDLKLLDAIGKALYEKSVTKKESIEKPSKVIKQLKTPGPSETLRSVASKESLKRLAAPLVGGSLSEVAEEPPLNSSREAAKKAIEEAAKRREQSGQNAGLSSEDLAEILQSGRQLTGGSGTQTAKLQEKQGQQIESQGSGKQKGFSI